MAEARHDFVVCCDATNVLEAAFIEKALAWFASPDVAAVFGSITQRPAQTVSERWRGRHLFKVDLDQQVQRGASFATGGAMVRASAVRGVGGYDSRLRQREDADLGERLLGGGFDVVFDPALTFTAIAPNSAAEVLERYWRWGAGAGDAASWTWYRKQIAYSVKVMARQDLAAGDFLSIPLSLIVPHYQFWRSLVDRRSPARSLR
jgi:cellulose synthase/poly-beta-1,6-N-acetylglucosamine synthase-like glycosyltransferase